MNRKYEWSEDYSKAFPVGFMLREAYKERWLRIHNLPHSKRYPEGKNDESELVKRNLESAKHILGTKNITLFVSFYSEAPNAKLSGPEWIKSFNFNWIACKDISDEDGEDPYYLITYGVNFDWNKELFKKIILDVVNENISNIAFFSGETKGIFSPYDGGADLFYLDKSQKIIAEKIFKNWLSIREDGL